jgi:hypothetical protein
MSCCWPSLFSGTERWVRQSPESLATTYRGAVRRPTGQLIAHVCQGIQVLRRDADHRYLAVPEGPLPTLRGSWRPWVSPR